MPINYSNTQAFIDNESADTNVTYADACTLIHMAKNEVSRMYEHESVTDASILVGYSSYALLNDDEVRAIIEWHVSKALERAHTENEIELSKMKLECDATVAKCLAMDSDEAFSNYLDTVKALQFASVSDNG